MIFDRTSETGRVVHALTDERDRLRLDVEAEHARAEILRKVLESTVAARDVAVARAERSEAEIERLRGVDACYAMAQEEIARMGVEIRRLKKLVSTSRSPEGA